MVPATITSLTLTNFSLDTVYLIRGVAYTALGPGPASTPVFFTLDPLAVVGRTTVFSATAAGGGDFEELGGQTWFIALIAGVLFVLVCLFIMLLVYRQISSSRKTMGHHHHQCLKEMEIKVRGDLSLVTVKIQSSLIGGFANCHISVFLKSNYVYRSGKKSNPIPCCRNLYFD